jgi:hypothetical protein
VVGPVWFVWPQNWPRLARIRNTAGEWLARWADIGCALREHTLAIIGLRRASARVGARVIVEHGAPECVWKGTIRYARWHTLAPPHAHASTR